MHLCGVVLLVTIHQQTYKGLRGKYQVFPNFLFLSYLSLSNEVRMYTQYPHEWVLTLANFPILKVSTHLPGEYSTLKNSEYVLSTQHIYFLNCTVEYTLLANSV